MWEEYSRYSGEELACVKALRKNLGKLSQNKGREIRLHFSIERAGVGTQRICSHL